MPVEDTSERQATVMVAADNSRDWNKLQALRARSQMEGKRVTLEVGGPEGNSINSRERKTPERMCHVQNFSSVE